MEPPSGGLRWELLSVHPQLGSGWQHCIRRSGNCPALLQQLAYRASAAMVAQHSREGATQASLWRFLSDAGTARLLAPAQHSCRHKRP